jgi:starvation-inducible outer membrane lipoprotein
MKKILAFSVFILLAACQNMPESTTTSSAEKIQVENEVAPCTNGFDDVNVCQLKS